MDKYKNLPVIKSRETKKVKFDVFDSKTGHNTYKYRYDYDDDWKEFEKLFCDYHLMDNSYLKNYRRIIKNSRRAKTNEYITLTYIRLYKQHKKKIDVESLSIKDIVTILTYYIASEKLSDGSIAEGLRNGNIEKLTTRLYKLTHIER